MASEALSSYVEICTELGCEPLPSLLECLKGNQRVAKLSSIQDAEQLYAATSILPYASIEELDLSSLQLPSAEQWDTLLEACSRCTGLRVLSIKGCNIGAHGPHAEEQLARQLGNCSLSVLEASQNQLGDTFLAAFSRSPLMREGETLTLLDLSENRLGDNGSAVLAATLAAAGLRSSLKQLDLSFNRLGDSGARALAAMLAAVPLLALELEGNKITDAGGLALADALKNTLCLQRLNLNSNQLGSSSLTSIAEALTVNAGSLQELAVAGSTGSEAGVAALLGAACRSKRLHMLDVRGIPLEGQAVDGLCELLASPCPLVTLRLDAGSREAAETIARALPTKPTLLHFMMGGNVPEHVLSFIATALSANTLHKVHAAVAGGSGSTSPVNPPPPQQQQQQQLLQAFESSATPYKQQQQQHGHRSPATAPTTYGVSAAGAGGRSRSSSMNTGSSPSSRPFFSTGAQPRATQSASPGCPLYSSLSRSSSASSGIGCGGGSASTPPQRMLVFGSPGGGGASNQNPYTPDGDSNIITRGSSVISAAAAAAAAAGRSPGSGGGGGGSGGSSSAAARAYVRSISSQARRASVIDPQGLAGLSGGGAANKAAEVFKRHDTDGSGFLGADEMMSALHELGMLEGMRPRQLGKFLSTAIREADSDKDGLVSLDDFTKYYERLARHYAEASRQGRISARRRAPEVPLDAPSDEFLKRAFRTYCRLPIGQGRQVGGSVQHINAAQFNQLCRDVGLMEPAGPLSQIAIDIVFTRCKPPGSRRLPFKHFLQALAGVADEASVGFGTISTAITNMEPPGTAAQLQQLLQQQQQWNQIESLDLAAAVAAAGGGGVGIGGRASVASALSRRHSLGAAPPTHTRLSVTDLTNTRVGPQLGGAAAARRVSAAAAASGAARAQQYLGGAQSAAAAAAAVAASAGAGADVCHVDRGVALRRPVSAGALGSGSGSSTPVWRGKVAGGGGGAPAAAASPSPWMPPLSGTVTPTVAQAAAETATQLQRQLQQQQTPSKQEEQEACKSASARPRHVFTSDKLVQQLPLAPRVLSGRETVQNPLFEGDSEGSLGGTAPATQATSISRRLSALEQKVLAAGLLSSTDAGTASGVGLGAVAGSGPGASSTAAVESRVCALEACVDEARQQLSAVQTQQEQLKGLLGRLLEGLEAKGLTGGGGGGGGGGGSSGGSNDSAGGGHAGRQSPGIQQLQQLVKKVDDLAADVAAVKGLQQQRQQDDSSSGNGSLQEMLDKLTEATNKRHTRMETAIYQVAHQVDMLDTRVKQEQQSTLRALQSLMSVNLSPKMGGGELMVAVEQPQLEAVQAAVSDKE